MAYDSPERLTYPLGSIDFGTGSDVTRVIPVPATGTQGRAGRVVGVLVTPVTENFAGSSSDAGVQVGDGTDADLYFDSGLVLDEDVDVGDAVWLTDDGSQVDIELGRSNVTVTCVANAGSPAGTAEVSVVIDWF